MKLFKKIGLFLSSFAPLFLLLITKEIIEIINKNWSLNFLNSFLLTVLILMLFIGIYYLITSLKEILFFKTEKILILNKSNSTDQHFLGYFSLFVLFAISYDIEMYSMAIIFFMVIVMIAIVYIKNDMYFINPLLNILGYSYYNIEFKNNKGEVKTAQVFYNGIIETDKDYYICTKYNSLFFLKKP